MIGRSKLFQVGARRITVLALLLTATIGSQKGFAISEVDEELEAGNEPKVTGYMQNHFNYPIGGGEFRFRVQRARVGVEGRVNSRITYEIDVDPRAPDHAGTLRDAFFNVKLNKRHTLRLGQHKVKFGFINQRSSSRLYVVNRPEMADELSRGINLRDIGATLIGKGPKGGGARLDYAFSVVNGAGMNAQRDDNKAKNLSGRVGFSGKKESYKWTLGASAAHGDKFETSNNPIYDGGYFVKFDRAGTDFFLDHDRFDLNGEFAIGKHKDRGDKETIHGYYMTFVGKSSRGIGPVLSYDSINDTQDVRVTLGAYYGERNEDFRVLMNYEFRGAVDTGRFYLWSLVRF